MRTYCCVLPQPVGTVYAMRTLLGTVLLKLLANSHEHFATIIYVGWIR